LKRLANFIREASSAVLLALGICTCLGMLGGALTLNQQGSGNPRDAVALLDVDSQAGAEFGNVLSKGLRSW
jgi:hypothetical protein